MATEIDYLINLAIGSFFGTDKDNAVPAKFFARPPYHAELLNEADQIGCVVNVNGINCLTFENQPGRCLAKYELCVRIAEKWNRNG